MSAPASTSVTTSVASAASRSGGRRSPARRPGDTVTVGLAKHGLLAVFALLCLFPVILVVSTALKSDADVRIDPFGLFGSFSLQNFIQAWTVGRFGDYLWNSVLLSVPTTLVVVALSTAAGYAFARCPFPGRTPAFYAVVLGLLVPFFTYMIPLYFQLRDVGLLDTLLGAQLVLVSTGLSFGVFFMRAFFLDLPNELEQAARVDGCSEWAIFWYVMTPLVRAGAGALGVFTFLQNWNNFLVPLLYLPSGRYTPLTAGLYVFASGRTLDVGPLAAGTLLTIVPVIVIFVAAQRHVIRGFIAGSVKG